MEFLEEKIQDASIRKDVSVESALQIDKLIREAVFDNGNPIINWLHKSNITGKLQIDIGDYLIDEVRDKYHVSLSFGEMDDIANRCIGVAKIRYKG